MSGLHLNFVHVFQSYSVRRVEAEASNTVLGHEKITCQGHAYNSATAELSNYFNVTSAFVV